MSRRCTGSRSQLRRELASWLSSKRSTSFGQGVTGGNGTSVGEVVSVVRGMLSCRAWMSEVGGVGGCSVEGS